jgi:DnaJ-class molecular chaperone
MENYDLLGVTRGAPLTEVKKAYRKLSLVQHPDKMPDCDVACQERWLRIATAHQQIVDFERGVLKIRSRSASPPSSASSPS